MGILVWLIGSSFGRKIALTGLAVLAIGMVALRIYMAGQAAEKAREMQRSLDLLRKRISSDDAISSMSSDERRKRLDQWTSE